MPATSWAPVYEQHGAPVKITSAYVLSGQLDRWFTQSFLPIAETPLSTWMMQETGYTKPAPPSSGGALVPSSGRGWPMRGRAGGGGGAPAVAAWWTTDDPSSVPVGAQVGDFVLDVTDGKVYEVVS